MKTNTALIIVDVQNDFVTGSLGTKEAQQITGNVVRLAQKADLNGDDIIFTRDTHQENYLETSEGKNLPIIHCVENTPGWQLIDGLKLYASKHMIINKPTFGCTNLPHAIKPETDRVIFCGLCTDICVISNVLLLKAFFPDIEICIVEDACAGVTPEKHTAAIEVARSCQIKIINMKETFEN